MHPYLAQALAEAHIADQHRRAAQLRLARQATPARGRRWTPPLPVSLPPLHRLVARHTTTEPSCCPA